MNHTYVYIYLFLLCGVYSIIVSYYCYSLFLLVLYSFCYYNYEKFSSYLILKMSDLDQIFHNTLKDAVYEQHKLLP